MWIWDVFTCDGSDPGADKEWLSPQVRITQYVVLFKRMPKPVGPHRSFCQPAPLYLLPYFLPWPLLLRPRRGPRRCPTHPTSSPATPRCGPRVRPGTQSSPVYTSSNPSASYVPAKPRLRLAVQVVVPSHDEKLPSRRFDPFADEPPVASTSQLQNVAPAPSHLARGRPLTPLCISSPLPPAAAPASPSPPTGRRRAPSFSAGSGAALPRTRDVSSLSSLTLSSQLCSAPSPAPSLTRIAPPQAQAKAKPEAPPVPLAPTPFHARHYPTPDARARLLARTLLNRIHAVGRPRSMYSCSAYAKTNGYESECGSRGYVRSRLSEVTMAC
ncbi:hypothetical protein MVEN_01080400 [Mycena venus]|uniref:Uncharacterized protein n=1 Tax=Mycena venus TaxID=2733690 RepID=A0A8H6Y855_9AGAR|nr:hypothetical protein MVEN_01080400 [Mycena venus]